MAKSRLENTVKNTVFLLGGYLLSSLLGFISRTVFIHTLGALYLGASGFFSNIFTLFSLSNLGLHTVIVFALYKPLAQGDPKKVSALMNFYSKAYLLVALFIAGVGLALLPFLNKIISAETEIPMLSTIYLLYLGDVVCAYLFSWRRALLFADQKQFVVELYSNIVAVFRTVIQIAVLFFTKNFLLYLFVQALFTLLTNLVINRVAVRAYPYLHTYRSEKLDKTERKTLFQNVRAMFMHNTSSIVLNGTDNIILAQMPGGLLFIGLYSNYLMIITIINTLSKMLFQAANPALGDLNATENKEAGLVVFEDMTLFTFWLYGFCATCLFVLLTPFVSLWLNEEYVIATGIVALGVFNFYLFGIRQTVLGFRTAMGLFRIDRYKAVAEAVLNIVLSLFLAQYMGYAGVFLGTSLSMILTGLWVEPLVLFKHGFQLPVAPYYRKMLVFIAASMAGCALTWFFCLWLPVQGLGGFALKILLCLTIPNLLYWLLFGRTVVGKRLITLLIGLLKRYLSFLKK